ncbi:MAG: 3-phosphoshikimate 1-carboxyvinyltransferase [Bifidobacteriaceae bacterium]|nr:3-phosphoshikimate 1-carboxyvinyltransferase [Bifidobacteriaceae bacterium]
MTPPKPWPAPVAAGRLDASVRLPGSKSLTARYLLLAAFARGPSRIRGALRARDSELMSQGLARLGAGVTWVSPDLVEVVPPAGGSPASAGPSRGRTTGWAIPGWAIPKRQSPGPAASPTAASPDAAASPTAASPDAAGGAPPAAAGRAPDSTVPGAAIDVGLAGTVMRFLAPAAALATGRFSFGGDPAAAGRPIRPLLRALADLGVEVVWPPAGRSLPFAVHGRGGVAGGSVRLDASASSQFLSALLASAPRFDRGLRVELDPPELPSRPHVELTVTALTRFGARAEQTGEWSWRVQPGGLAGQDLAVEPDLSNAAPFLAAALVAGGQVRVPDWPRRTDQAGDRLREYLAAYGAEVAWSPGPTADQGVLSVSAPGGTISGVELDLSPAGELTPTLAALAALAESPSRLVGIGHLRGHETNRLAALTCEINRLGGDARELADGIEIHPAPLRGGLARTYGDHRMAAFAALIGLATPGVLVEDVGVTAKTLPGFAALWQAMVAE